MISSNTFTHQCATKTIILHLQWTESEVETVMSPIGVNDITSPSGNGSGGAPPPSFTRSRTTSALSFTKSNIGIRTPAPASGRRQSGPQIGSASGPLTPITPLSNSRTTTPAFGVGRTASLNVSLWGSGPSKLTSASLTTPPKLIALIETPDVALGAVDPRKRRVVTATRFSSRMGADRRVSFVWGKRSMNLFTNDWLVDFYIYAPA